MHERYIGKYLWIGKSLVDRFGSSPDIIEIAKTGKGAKFDSSLSLLTSNKRSNAEEKLRIILPISGFVPNILYKIKYGLTQLLKIAKFI